MFLEHYREPSCTSGRTAFITGELPIRSGMTRIGFPGDKLGLMEQSPCLAENMKAAGYATGHFGKNHLGDRNEYLLTVHGFDEFFGNLYHLNTTRMHLYTRLNDEWRTAAADNTSDVDFQGSGMLQHDHDIGKVLAWLDEQGLSENAIVWYSTDNGREHTSWPHGATTPLRGEKMTTYEGGIRVGQTDWWTSFSASHIVENVLKAHEQSAGPRAPRSLTGGHRRARGRSRKTPPVNNQDPARQRSKTSACGGPPGTRTQHLGIKSPLL